MGIYIHEPATWFEIDQIIQRVGTGGPHDNRISLCVKVLTDVCR